MQYAHARANNILERAKSNGALPVYRVPEGYALTDPEKLLVRLLYELPEAVERAAEGLAPSVMTEYVYQLASAFMSFYETTPVMNADTQELRSFRLALVDCYRAKLKESLTILGIPAPTRM
ncbi:Arginine--tRNA ligase [bioreactor metagenome]|uniref:arginine--tRNA ligase n=1 Tax=bioreactor metagenome TaxID=1076179 RepID=A0A645EB97_9ZZZZ